MKLPVLIMLLVTALTGCSNQGESSNATSNATPSRSKAQTEPKQAPSIVQNPADVPPSAKQSGTKIHRIDLEAVELQGQLAEGTTYPYMTFNGHVPGPFLRVHVQDRVELHLKNRKTNHVTHSIDLHAATGPGGGSAVMQASPGQEKVVTFQALKPGLFVYHCATAMVAEHITSGMYGLILVEPPSGLKPVDREFYVMQGELYTRDPFGEYGLQSLDRRALLQTAPEYLLFNGDHRGAFRPRV